MNLNFRVLCSSDRSKAVHLLQFFIRTKMVSYVAFILSLFVSHLSFFCCLGNAVLRDCGFFGIFIYSFVMFACIHVVIPSPGALGGRCSVTVTSSEQLR